MRALLVPLLVVTLIALVLGMTGGLHPIGDSFAVGRLYLGAFAALISLLLLATRARAWAFAGLLGAVSGLWPLTAWLAESPPGSMVIYQKNMRFDNPTPEAVARDLQEVAPDFVTLQELSDDNLAVFDRLVQTHPSQFRCPLEGIGASAVMSRFPLIEGSPRCMPQDSVAAMRVAAPQGLVWLVSVHLRWPFPFGQGQQRDRIAGFLAKLEGPVIIGGDFNMVPWGQAVQSFAAATDSASIGPPRASLPLLPPLVQLPIDHVLAPGGQGSTQLRPTLGSDHHGLVARIAPGALQ